MKKILILTSLLLLGVGCTKNARARNFGGSEIIILKDHEILVNATWKDMDLWVLSKDTLTGKHHFRESSSWGVWEGQIIFN